MNIRQRIKEAKKDFQRAQLKRQRTQFLKRDLKIVQLKQEEEIAKRQANIANYRTGAVNKVMNKGAKPKKNNITKETEKPYWMEENNNNKPPWFN